MKLRIIFNLASFYVGWFACVIGAGKQMPLLGPVVVTILLITHLILVSKQPRRESVFLCIVGVYGFFIETIVITFSVYQPLRFFMPHPWCPVWMLALWINFGTTFNHCLRFLHNQIKLGAILGAVGGPLAFWGGTKLNALRITGNFITTYGILACIWALSVPILFFISKRLSPGRS